jgi:hypothetical protein
MLEAVEVEHQHGHVVARRVGLGDGALGIVFGTAARLGRPVRRSR